MTDSRNRSFNIPDVRKKQGHLQRLPALSAHDQNQAIPALSHVKTNLKTLKKQKMWIWAPQKALQCILVCPHEQESESLLVSRLLVACTGFWITWSFKVVIKSAANANSRKTKINGGPAGSLWSLPSHCPWSPLDLVSLEAALAANWITPCRFT